MSSTATRQPRVSNKDVQALVRQFNKGYSITKNGDHFKVMNDVGEPVLRDDGSPLMIAGTPRSGAIPVIRRELEQYGVIGGEEERREHRPDEELRTEQLSQRLSEEEKRQRGAELHRAVNPWIGKVGGWNAQGLVSDLAQIFMHLGYYEDEGPAMGDVTRMRDGMPTFRSFTAMMDVHARVSESDDPAASFFDLVRIARGIKPTDLMGDEEWPFKVELIPLSKLFPDETYQRPAHGLFVRELVLKFDERLVGSLDVSRRRGGRFAILDGLQRFTAMTTLGKKAAWCAVYDHMTIEDEARFFFHKNKDRKAIHPYYHFRAKLVSGDPKVNAIQAIVNKFGFSLSPGGAPDENIAAIKAIENAYDYAVVHRDECLTPTLETIKSIWFGRKSALDGGIIRGFARFFQAYPDDVIQWEHWTAKLQDVGPSAVLGRARDEIAQTYGKSLDYGVATELVKLHNQGLERGLRLSARALDTAAKEARTALANAA